MASTKETYRIAAREHLERAQDLFDVGSCFLAHYLSGLAVECHLRAWLLTRKTEFDSRHDLELLAKESGFDRIIPKGQSFDFSLALQIVNKRWRSNHRYYSERQLLDYLTGIRAEFNVPGDRWKNLARTLLTYAHRIIRQGESKWRNG